MTRCQEMNRHERAYEEHAKRLKLSWVREHYHEVKAASNEKYLLKLFEMVIQQQEEERKLNLLISQSSLPDISSRQFDWNGIHMNGDIVNKHIIPEAYFHIPSARQLD